MKQQEQNLAPDWNKKRINLITGFRTSGSNPEERKKKNRYDRYKNKTIKTTII